MTINPYQSVIPGMQGNALVNPYQNVVPGTTGNVAPIAPQVAPPPITVAPPKTTTINTETIGVNPVRFPVPPAPAPVAMPVAPIAPQPTAEEQAATFAGSVAPPTTPAETERSGLISRFSSLSEKLFGKQQAQQQAETTQGIPEKAKAVSDIQAQINQLQNDANAAMIKAQTAGETTSFGNAQIAQIERDRTVKALQLNSFLYAANGNLATAQDMADRAVSAQFAPMEEEIKYLEKFIELNKDDLSREDKKRADALTIQLNERKRILDEQKAERTAINNIAIEAAKNGADAVTLNKIGKATTQEEALGNAGEFLGAEHKLALQTKQLAERQFTESVRQFNLKFAQDQSKIEAEKGIDPAQLVAYGQQYASTGKIPTGIPKGSFGAISAYAKELPKENGAIVDKNTGTAPDAAETLINGMAAIYSAVDLAKQLKQLDEERITGITSATLGKVFGSADQQRYVDLKQQITDLLARARTGAAMTASEEKFYGDMLPGRIGQVGFGLFGANTGVRIDNFISNLSNDLQNKATTRGWAVQGLSTVSLGGKEYKVGDVITVNGVSGRILADGSISLIQ